jgi:hypothetical protein
MWQCSFLVPFCDRPFVKYWERWMDDVEIPIMSLKSWHSELANSHLQFK